MTRGALYPGTFDPATNGHLDLIERGRRLFDHLVVAVARNPSKSPLFDVDERVAILEELVADWADVSVASFSGLVVDFARQRGDQFILRGIRSVTDFDFEYQMALTNRSLAPGVDTVFMMPDARYSFISSTLIKDIVSNGGDVSRFVSPNVGALLEKKLKPR